MSYNELTGPQAMVDTKNADANDRAAKDALPPANTSRWVVRRKAEVVAAIDSGLLTIAEACSRYDLTLEELASWQRAVEREGIAGLRATRVQHYRQLHERQSRR